MDFNFAEAAISAVVGAGTAIVGVVVLAYRIGVRFTAVEKTADEAKKKADKNEADIDTMTKEQGESWQQLNRTLGQIEGVLSVTEHGTNPGVKRK